MLRKVEVLAERCKLVLRAAFSKVCTKPGICILQGLIFTKGFSGQISLGNNGLNTHEQFSHCRTVQRFDQGILFFSRTISQVFWSVEHTLRNAWFRGDSTTGFGILGKLPNFSEC